MKPQLAKEYLRWLRWPEDKHIGRVPWFIVLWRLPWIGLTCFGLLFAWIGIAMCFGLEEAGNFFRRNI